MCKDKPLVSVVIPTYNRANTIKRCIDSVLNQTYKNIEVIVVDDGSTDKTKEVVDSYEDPRVRYISYRTNRGANYARNTGIKKGKGELIALQDSDDAWHPEKIEKQLQAYVNSPSDHKVVYTGTLIKNGRKQFYMPEKWVHPKEGDVHRPMLRSTFANTVTILTKKECLEQIGYFDENIPRAQDWELGLRLSKKYKFKLVDEPLVTTYPSKGSITKNYEAHADAYEIILEKHKDSFMKHPDILSSHYFFLAAIYFNLDNWKKAIINIKKAYGLKPLHPITIMRLLASLLGSDFYRQFRGLYRRIFL